MKSGDKGVLEVNVVSANQPNTDIPCCSDVVDPLEEVTTANVSDISDCMVALKVLSFTIPDITALQQADPDIITVLSWVEDLQRPVRRQIKGASQCLRKFWTEFSRLTIIDGLLCRSLVLLRVSLGSKLLFLPL